MKINIHAGHNPAGKIACGAVGILDESRENRKVVKRLIKLLRKEGHTVYNCTVNNGTSQSDVLKKIIKKSNAHSVTIDISVHFNSGANDKKGNGKTTGTEVIVYSLQSEPAPYAKRIADSIASLGFTNRGVKVSMDLAVLWNKPEKALLVECCFVDDADDAKLYNADKMAKAIAEGILGYTIYKKPLLRVNQKSKKNDIFWLQQHLDRAVKDKGGRIAVTGKWNEETTKALLLFWKQIGWNKKGTKKGKAAGLRTLSKLSAYS